MVSFAIVEIAFAIEASRRRKALTVEPDAIAFHVVFVTRNRSRFDARAIAERWRAFVAIDV